MKWPLHNGMKRHLRSEREREREREREKLRERERKEQQSRRFSSLSFSLSFFLLCLSVSFSLSLFLKWINGSFGNCNLWEETKVFSLVNLWHLEQPRVIHILMMNPLKSQGKPWNGPWKVAFYRACCFFPMIYRHSSRLECERITRYMCLDYRVFGSIIVLVLNNWLLNTVWFLSDMMENHSLGHLNIRKLRDPV